MAKEGKCLLLGQIPSAFLASLPNNTKLTQSPCMFNEPAGLASISPEAFGQFQPILAERQRLQWYDKRHCDSRSRPTEGKCYCDPGPALREALQQEATKFYVFSRSLAADVAGPCTSRRSITSLHPVCILFSLLDPPGSRYQPPRGTCPPLLGSPPTPPTALLINQLFTYLHSPS